MKKNEPPNPYLASSYFPSSVLRGRAGAIMVAFAIGCYGLAGLLYVCARSWTFHTPYSQETTWEVSLPGRISFEMSSSRGMLALALLGSLGTLFLLLAFIRGRLSSSKSENDRRGG